MEGWNFSKQCKKFKLHYTSIKLVKDSAWDLRSDWKLKPLFKSWNYRQHDKMDDCVSYILAGKDIPQCLRPIAAKLIEKKV